MKKWMSMLLALILTMAGACAVQAVEEVTLDGTEDAYTWITGLVGTEDELLMRRNVDMGGSKIELYRDGQLSEVWRTEKSIDWNAATQEERSEAEKYLTSLFQGDDGMYAYAQYGQQLYKWDGAAFAQAGERLSGLEFTYTEDGREYIQSIERACVIEGKLFAVLSGNESTDYNPLFYVFDVSTGKGTQLEVEGIDYVQGLSNYKDGKVLVCYQDPNNDYNMTIRALDIATGKLDEAAICEMDTYSGSGLAYDAQEDTVYYADGTIVYKRTADGNVQPLAYLPVNYADRAALSGGKYTVAVEQSLYRVATDGSDMPTQTLRVQGGWADDVQRGFVKENPSVGIGAADTWYGSSEEIANAIRTGDTGIDIFTLYTGNGLYAVLNKGYALDLSGSQIITEAVDSYYPGLARALKDENGHICGIYNNIEPSTLPTVNKELWEKLDMGDYPRTYSELIDLLLMWEEDYAEEYPEYLAMHYDDKRELINMVIRAFIVQYESSPEGLNFNSPALREVLEKIDRLPVENMDWENMTEADWEEYNERYQRDVLISLSSSGAWQEGMSVYMQNGDGESYSYHVLDPLVFEEGETPVASFNGEVYFINPESPNKELAIQYLEYRAQHMNDYYRYMLDPSLTEPVRMEGFEQTVKSMEKELAELTEEMEKADEVDKEDYQARIDYYTRWLEEKDKNQWEISPQAIERYREMGEYGVVLHDSLFLTYDGESSGPNQVYETVDRYADGQLTLDAFLRELEQKTKMITLEGR